jgi:eukaryotic-like serine/threonine-protein kinase
MTPQHWREIEDLYHAALDREPGEPAALLAQADPELRREAESLLAQVCSAIIQSVVKRPSFLANIRSAGRREPASN